MSTEMIISLIAFAASVALAVALIVLYKKRVIDEDAISGASKVLEGIAVSGGLFETIRQYAETAVKTVEQMVKTGAIDRDDAMRKSAAMNIVRNAAEVDGIKMGAAEILAASDCIEAEVQNLPRNQKPPDFNKGGEENEENG